ncbi:MAG TPA: hypothetical protein VHC40_06860 [Rhizomicrobium sp.]|nr:hypothetical protein [Rhizomicrobium sp.]
MSLPVIAAFSLLPVPAFAVQEVPVAVNGVETVCTGVGSAKDDPRWAAYPVKIVLASVQGENLANVHLTLAKGGRTLAEIDCDAPWILVRAPAGSYTATATLIGGSGAAHSAQFATSGKGPQKEVNILFARPQPTTQ